MTTQKESAFVWDKGLFMENAFQRRYLGILRESRRKQLWFVVGAEPGSGKSSGIRALVRESRAQKISLGLTRSPVIAINTPQIRTERAVGLAIVRQFGVAPTMTWEWQRGWIVSQLARMQTELLIVDDAHDIHLSHLLYIKELTDTLAALPYERQIGLCFVCASTGHNLQLQQTLMSRPELVWQQFRRRLSSEQPYRVILGHSAEEVAEICAGYEDRYRKFFPELNLVRWADAIYDYLTHPNLDQSGTRRVTMDNICKYLKKVLELAAHRGLTDVSPELLHNVATIMIFRKDAIREVDGEPDDQDNPDTPLSEVG